MLLPQCQGKDLSWSHIVALYLRNGGAATGLNLIPKLKYEHVYLTSHSKMRVDLAAQVCTCVLYIYVQLPTVRKFRATCICQITVYCQFNIHHSRSSAAVSQKHCILLVVQVHMRLLFSSRKLTNSLTASMLTPTMRANGRGSHFFRCIPAAKILG